MLTAEQRQHIKDEEYYREEVRRQLKPLESQSISAKTWRLLNSSFGLWLLSSLLLSGLTAAYTHWRTNVALRQQHDQDIDRCASQLAVRLNYGRSLFVDNSTAGPAGNINVKALDKRSYYFETASAFLDDKVETRLFPEFKDRSTLSIVLQVQTLTENEPIDIEQARPLPNPSTPHEQIEAIITDIEELMRLRLALDPVTYKALSGEQQDKLFQSLDKTLKALSAVR